MGGGGPKNLVHTGVDVKKLILIPLNLALAVWLFREARNNWRGGYHGTFFVGILVCMGLLLVAALMIYDIVANGVSNER